MTNPFQLNAGIDEPGAARVMQRCEHLASFTSLSDGVKRIYLSTEHRHCNTQVATWMQEAGMSTRVDAAGNIWGYYRSDNGVAASVEDAAAENATESGVTSTAKVRTIAHGDIEELSTPGSLILGSHLDSVTNAGKYDGILGVVCAIEIVDYLNRQNIRLPFAIEVVGFADEEGTRFGTTLLGSRAVVGQWRDEWQALTDADGITLSRAMQNFGLDVCDIKQADRSGDNILAYLELHIEQGPVLEQENQSVGVVSSIAGARRFMLNFKGVAGHAGTVPMNMRRDPMVAAALAIEQVEQIAKLSPIVATVGKITCWPNSVNVIPAACEMSLDIRSGQDSSRDYGVDTLFATIQQMCDSRQIEFSTREIHNAPAVQCSSWIQRMTEDLLQEGGFVPISLVSGAGHDAMVFNDLTDIGMLFVRCKEGISHHPAESVTVGDVHDALNVFYKMVVNLWSSKQASTAGVSATA